MRWAHMINCMVSLMVCRTIGGGIVVRGLGSPGAARQCPGVARQRPGVARQRPGVARQRHEAVVRRRWAMHGQAIVLRMVPRAIVTQVSIILDETQNVLNDPVKGVNVVQGQGDGRQGRMTVKESVQSARSNAIEMTRQLSLVWGGGGIMPPNGEARRSR